jgi:malate dehydrogenase (oxaloacetate-decarboxylating)
MTKKLKIKESGIDLLKCPMYNKNTAFSAEEREQFDLDGLLPPHIETIEEQLVRCYAAYKNKDSDIGRHIYLRALQDRNETLFYHFVRSHLTEVMPIIYTPVVGEACMRFSQIYRQPRGLFISYPQKDRIAELLDNSPLHADVKVIVVTDGERILGLGDQGVDGMGIPIGKLSLYTACGGIAPKHTLPITLDVGTNNVERRHHPDYLGWRNERITGQDYDDFLELFVSAVKEKFPNVLLQFEDFAQTHASPLLKRYRNQLCTFNDDIQGTAAVCVSALLAATKVLDSKLSDHRIAVVGGGSAGCGISEMLIQAMQLEGVSEEDARERFYVIDRYGLLDDSMKLLGFQKPFARAAASLADWPKSEEGHIDFECVMKKAKPTILLGVSGQPAIFTHEIVELMNEYCERPIIFPMSNPTSRCEAHPSDLIQWTKGGALVATGSPFKAVEYEGKQIQIAQSNNSYIFPGLGLGIVSVKARYVSDEMLMAASIALSEFSPALIDKTAPLLPSLEDIMMVSKKIAFEVGKVAIRDGHADEISEDEIKAAIDKTFWDAEYFDFERDK